MALLEVNELVSGYGSLEVLHGISLEVAEGEIVSVLGANGAGKTTFLRAVSGVLDTWSGSVSLAGDNLAGMSVERRAGAGLGHLPEGRGVFQNLTVRENLDLGTVLRRDGAAAVNADRDRLLGIFPDLAEKIRDGASSLSGGQQQMLALARAMLTRPKLLMIDELSFGLAPFLVDELFSLVTELRDEGNTFLLIEQNAQVLDISDRTYVFKTGNNDISGPSAELRQSHDLVRSYLGT
ncbi:MAG: ABC transporter ATP-binding protein [bacterium]|nr:ABC transporter ATP-binding protein [bacterium]MXZ29522.1 ABC transporter ATP-binding protein [Acidimicrobiia bacterium]MDE0667581.1 ABC transporter ATP-binding protein [bacterium]MYB25100.1 ABC transporter ATP-binding protein [Acidimicrobiia bacterium]MYE67369.1 ABC transporter ATP-binding protein [Acidimicrobiia bacterium]